MSKFWKTVGTVEGLDVDLEFINDQLSYIDLCIDGSSVKLLSKEEAIKLADFLYKGAQEIE